jgi:DNA repair exonuclease SbcCD ATPase subunit
MRLKAISITGFGGIADSVAIDLSADVVIISGANGFGKTTVCNAVVWALSGVHPSGADPRSLYSTSGTTSVQLTLSNGTQGDIVVGRSLSNPGNGVTSNPDWVVSVRAGAEDTMLGSAAENWLKTEFAKAESTADFVAVMSGAMDAIYLKQESLRDFLVDRSDVERFSSIAQMVGAGKLSKFVSQLESEKTAWVRATNRIEGELLESRQEYEEQVLRARALELEISLAKTPEISARWTNWQQTAFPDSALEALEELSEEALDRARNDIIGRRREAERRSAELRSLVAELDLPLPPAIPQSDLVSARTAFENARETKRQNDLAAERMRVELAQRTEDFQRLSSQRDELAAMASTALKHVSAHCPACGQSVDETEFISRLDAIIADASTPALSGGLEAAREALSRTEAAVASSAAEVSRTQAAVLDLETQIAAHESFRLSRWERAAAAGYEVPSSTVDDIEDGYIRGVVDIATAEDARIAQSLLSLSDLEQQLSAFEPAVEIIRSQGRLERIEADLVESLSAIDSRQTDLTERQSVSVRADALVQNLKSDSEQFVEARIASLQPILDQFYSAIDPHPTFRTISITTKLFGGKHRLDPILRDEGSDVTISEPGRTLSTSQANALAVALFMSFNMGFSSSGLSTMILDDPLQNLDDIHLLGLVDLLRRLAPHRQLILTTHDQSFASLLVRKLRPVSESARTEAIRFTKWDRSGPGIETVAVPYGGDPVKIALAG